MRDRGSMLFGPAAFAAALSIAAHAVAATDQPRLPRPRPAVAEHAAPSEVGKARASEELPVAAEPNLVPATPDVAYARLERHFEVAAEARLPRPRPAGPTDAAPKAVTYPSAAIAPDLAATPPELAYAAGGAPRLPRVRPAAAAAILAALTPDAAVPEESHEPKSIQDLPFAGPTFSNAEEASCRAKLRDLGVTFEETEPLDPGGACFVANPLTVTGLGQGVAMKPSGMLNCPTAVALAEWVQDAVVPAAKRELGEAPVSITHASTYVCRSRYNRPGAKVSEHAFGAAVDVAAIRFKSHDAYEVKRQTSATDRRFQAAIRGAACEHFTTVLGPGSNAAHETHLHLDTAQRRGGYRLCELDPPPLVAEAPAEAGDTADEKTSRE